MDPERRLALARKGGASVPGHLRSFAQDRALASSAGVKGGKARHNPKRPPDAPGDD
jgi:general stress protein YciG